MKGYIFRPEDIDLPLKILSREEMTSLIHEDTEPFYYCILNQDGFIDELGTIMGELQRYHLRMDLEFNYYFFDVGFHGTYKNGVASYYVPGHEEGNPTEETLSPAEFLKFFLYEVKDSFSLFSSTYYHQRAVEEAWAQEKRDKGVRATRNFYMLLSVTIVIILYFVVYKRG